MTLAKHPKRRQQQLPHLLGARQLGNDDASGQDNSADQQPETTISGVIDEGDNTALFTVTSTSTTGPSDATSDPSASTSSSSSASDDQSTRAGLIAGLCVGLTVVVVILAFVVWKCWKRGKSPSSSKQAAASRSLAADSKEALPMQDYAPFEHHSAQSRLGTSEKGPTPPPRSADAASSLYTISTAPPQSSSIPMPHQPPPAAAPQRPHDRYSRAASSKEQSRSNRNTRKSVVSWFSLNKPSVKDQFMWYRTSTGLDGDDEELQDRSLATGNAAAFEQSSPLSELSEKAAMKMWRSPSTTESLRSGPGADLQRRDTSATTMTSSTRQSGFDASHHFSYSGDLPKSTSYNGYNGLDQAIQQYRS